MCVGVRRRIKTLGLARWVGWALEKTEGHVSSHIALEGYLRIGKCIENSKEANYRNQQFLICMWAGDFLKVIATETVNVLCKCPLRISGSLTHHFSK